MPATSELLDRLPPSDVDAERYVLSAMLLKPSLVSDVTDKLDEADFYTDANRTLFAAMLRMEEAGTKIDAGTLLIALRRSGEIETVGGAAYLAEICHAAPVWHHWDDYADTVKEKAVARRLIHALTNAMKLAYDPTVSPRDALVKTEALLSKIDNAGGEASAVPVRDAVEEALERAYAANRGEKFGLATGFANIDSVAGGLFRSEFTILAARPSQGKTALACQWADHLAEKHDVLFVSLEMTRAELASRILCRRGEVDSGRIRRADLDDGDLQRLIVAGNAAAESGLWIQDRATMTMRDIRRSTARLASRGRLAAVLIDYIQLVDPIDRKQNRYEQLGEIAKACKRLAKEFDVAVVALCQVSRAADGEMPKLIHLRESGNLEQEADTVFALMRNVAWSKDAPANENQAALEILKARNASRWTVHLEWYGPTTSFSDPDVGKRESAFDQYDGSHHAEFD